MDHDRESYRPLIESHLGKTLSKTDFPLPHRHEGKVRDSYRLDKERMVIVTTDRQSAFDRVLANIPFKGTVLNLVSAWWFEQTGHIMPNHLLGGPHPNGSVVTACEVFPIEVIVRGYITGTTDTSLWTHYANGERLYCGNALPEGLRKNQKLDHALLTPTTKETHHDRPISPAEIIAEGWMEAEDWEVVAAKALELFEFGRQKALEHGLILVDTKYEFGKDADGVIRIIDELHTPDSSRYWLADSYQSRFDRGEEPLNIDKEFLPPLVQEGVATRTMTRCFPRLPRRWSPSIPSGTSRSMSMITGNPFSLRTGDSETSTPEDMILTSNLASADAR
jgi:phosphoribosylaminoimidazole-succinocarboxamide synthase